MQARSLFRATLVLSLLAASANAAALSLPRAPREVAVDGVLSEWQGNNAYPLRPVATATGIEGMIFLGWDADYLYIAAAITDPELSCTDETSRAFNNSDGLQVTVGEAMLVATPSSPYQAPLKTVLRRDGSELLEFDLRQVRLGRQVVKNGYTLELALPWRELGIVPAPEANFPFGVLVRDAQKGKLVGRYTLTGEEKLATATLTF